MGSATVVPYSTFSSSHRIPWNLGPFSIHGHHQIGTIQLKAKCTKKSNAFFSNSTSNFSQHHEICVHISSSFSHNNLSVEKQKKQPLPQNTGARTLISSNNPHLPYPPCNFGDRARKRSNCVSPHFDSAHSHPIHSLSIFGPSSRNLSLPTTYFPSTTSISKQFCRHF